MPKPNAGETKDAYISRCIPIVINEGTAKDGSQAAAICHSMWEKHLSESSWSTRVEEWLKGRESLWVDARTMEVLCPSCAESMKAKGLDRINLRASEQMPEQMKQGLCKAIGGDPGFFESCMGKSLGTFDPGDKESFCAWLHKECTGMYPGEHESAHPKVSESFMPFTAQRGTLAVSLAPSGQSDHSWEVVLLSPKTPDDIKIIDGQTYIRSANGRYYNVAALEAATPMFDGAKVYDDHLTDAEFQARGGMRSVAREWLGSIVRPVWDRATLSIRGVFKAVDDSFNTKLLRAKAEGVLDTIGLSIDVFQDGVMRRIGEAVAQLVNVITRVNSVDAVGSPATGGGFVRLLESILHVKEQGNMDEVLKQIEQLIAAIDASMLPDDAKAALKKHLEEIKAGLGKPAPEAPAGGAGAQAVEATQAAWAARAAEAAKIQEAKRALEAIGPMIAKALADAETQTSEAQRILDEAKAESKKIIDAARVTESARILDADLTASGLPKPVRELLREQYSGRAFEAADLKKAIDAHRKAFVDAETELGRVHSHGHRPLIQVGRVTEADRFGLDLLRMMMGNTRFTQFDLEAKDKAGRAIYGAFKELGYTRAVENWVADGKPSLPRSLRLSEWYYEFTGGGDRSAGDLGGVGQFSQRAIEANLTTTTLASVVKNAVNILLAADYSIKQQWWDSIVEQEDVDTIDQATLVRVFGVSTLPIVTEGGAYTELDMEDEEEIAIFYKRGGFIGVTLETFLRDKINVLRSIPNRLSNSWFNTIGGRVAAVFTLNSDAGPTLSDTGSLFNATAVASATGHANLLTTALSHAAWDAVVTAMMNQTDQPLGAGEKLGMENKPGHLLVPVNLRNTALEIRNSEKVPGFANLTNNQYYQDFEVVVVPNWTDATNWAALSKPSGLSPIKLIWLRGRRTPELFEAGAEESGAMFTNDEIRYKVRQFNAAMSYASTPVTYSAPVADWRSIHKSNVAG